MCTRTCMGTKTITIMDDAYDILVGYRDEDYASFSEVIRKLDVIAKNKNRFKDLFGAISHEKADMMRKMLKDKKEFESKHKNERIKQWRS